MGAYLSAPVTDKEQEEGSLPGNLHFAASAMQGWRRGMEDEHIAVKLEPPQTISSDTNVAMFGVWDGHGGQEVAKFVKVHMCKELEALEEYQNGDMGAALVKVFHRMDELLWDKANLAELNSYKAGAKASAEEDKDDDEDEAGGDGEDKLSKGEVMDLFKMLMKAKAAKGPMPDPSNDDDDSSSSGLSPRAVASLVKGDGASGGGGGGSLQDTGAGSTGSSAGPSRAIVPTTCELPNVHVTAGCTSVVAVLVGHKLVVANAGDSRGVLCHNGKATALSEDHKPSQDRERSRIEAVGGFVNGAGRVNGNLNLSRSLGDLKYKQAKEAPPSAQMITAEPDILTFDIDPATDEFMVLACDGIWDCFSNDDCVDFVKSRLAKGKTPLEISAEACDVCLAEDPKTTQGIGGDNMTFLLVVFGDHQPRGQGI